MNLPNKLTLLRMLMVPVFVGCFYLPPAFSREVCAAVFLLAFLTDILDGHLARKGNIVTNFGKLMDPIADKLLTFAAFIMLVAEGSVSPIATIIVMARELLVSGLRLLAVNDGKVIAASIWGKLKTVSQCVAIMFLLLWERIDFLSFPVDQVVLWISVALTIFSGVDYVVKNFKKLNY